MRLKYMRRRTKNQKPGFQLTPTQPISGANARYYSQNRTKILLGHLLKIARGR
jgi:hypothetical protein|tara:strand:+ start:1347 stop:1505 length:159 start_codon:yes stop_codon:yes gene_type:complete